jgi:hypothetical protein
MTQAQTSAQMSNHAHFYHPSCQILLSIYVNSNERLLNPNLNSSDIGYAQCCNLSQKKQKQKQKQTNKQTNKQSYLY